MFADQFRICVVNLITAMGAGAGGHAAPDGAAIHHGHFSPRTGQFEGRRKPGDTSTYDQHIGPLSFPKSGKAREFCLRPQGAALFAIDIHGGAPVAALLSPFERNLRPEVPPGNANLQKSRQEAEKSAALNSPSGP